MSGTTAYTGAVLDGRFVYFAPDTNLTDSHGKVIRYDSRAPFKVAESWQAYDAGNTGGLSDTTGYHFAAFNGRFIYFVPEHDGTAAHGRVLRYDTGGVN